MGMGGSWSCTEVRGSLLEGWLGRRRGRERLSTRAVHGRGNGERRQCSRGGASALLVSGQGKRLWAQNGSDRSGVCALRVSASEGAELGRCAWGKKRGAPVSAAVARCERARRGPATTVALRVVEVCVRVQSRNDAVGKARHGGRPGMAGTTRCGGTVKA